MTAKEEIRDLLDVITDEEAEALWRKFEHEYDVCAPLTAEERSRIDLSLAQLDRGERLSEDEVFRDLGLD